MEQDTDHQQQMAQLHYRQGLVKFNQVCHQISQLNAFLDQQLLRHHQAKVTRQKSFKYTLGMRIAVVEGVRDMFLEYASRKAEELDELHELLAGQLNPALEEEGSEGEQEEEVMEVEVLAFGLV